MSSDQSDCQTAGRAGIYEPPTIRVLGSIAELTTAITAGITDGIAGLSAISDRARKHELDEVDPASVLAAVTSARR